MRLAVRIFPGLKNQTSNPYVSGSELQYSGAPKDQADPFAPHLTGQINQTSWLNVIGCEYMVGSLLKRKHSKPFKV